MNNKILAVLFAFSAAALYAINIPVSKILLRHVPPVCMAAFLYLGAGFGMPLLSLFGKKDAQAQKLTKKELPYTLAMIGLDIAAPIFLMRGLTTAHSANVSLLNNFEIAATALTALLVFKEKISFRMWIAIALVTFSSMLLSFEGSASLHFSSGSLYVLAACLCWGFENNCTKMLSSKSTKQIVMLKGIFSGLGSLLIAFFLKEPFPPLPYIGYVLVLGFIAYGLSIFFYVRAQNSLGASKTSACYAASPFIGSLLSFILLKEALSAYYLPALLIMLAGTAFIVADTLILRHSHLHTHIIRRMYNGTVREYVIEHEHPHYHLLSHEAEHTHRFTI